MPDQPAQRRCFISYCHEGIDRGTLDYVVHVLRDALGRHAELLFDIDVKYGGDIAKFMAMLDTVDVVVIVLTPNYRARVKERRGGVYTEYSRIWNRYIDLRPNEIPPRDRFEIIPILFSGSFETSTPDEIVNLRHLDLTGLHVTQRTTGEFVIPHHVRARYEEILRHLATQIFAATAVGSGEFQKLSDSYYDRLFIDLKANFDDPKFAGHNYLRSILVKTHAYRRIESQLAYLVIGRKGSGKSTLTQVLPLVHPDRYEGIIKIVADQFNLETLFTLYSDQQFRSDVSAAVPRDRAFEFTWEALLMLATIENIVALDDAGVLNHVQQRQLPALREFISTLKGKPTITGGGEWRPPDLFNFAFDATMRFVRDCIGGAREDASFFLTDITVRFNRERYLDFVFGASVLEPFRRLLQTFSKKFLVTLDGFDTAFDRFRQNALFNTDPESVRRRALFEIDWLRSLLALVMQAKSTSRDHFYDTLDFCIAAPKDRFMEVTRIERDSYRHWQRWCALNWSGIELAILLRKRLEVLMNYQTRKDRSPQERLEDVLSRKFLAKLPKDIEFDYNNHHYSMPLFMYVLRHTFWRPREVLYFYGALLALVEEMSRWDYEISAEMVRKCVKATTTRVIESEFMNEFHTTAVNIRDIVNAFRRAPSVLSYDQLHQRLIDVDFKFAAGPLGASDTRDKLHFLYEIGFLGIVADKAFRDAFGCNLEHVFMFNEGPSALHSADNDEITGWNFVIHPIFSEYLRLDTDGRELTMRFTWEYLHFGEAIFAAAPWV